MNARSLVFEVGDRVTGWALDTWGQAPDESAQPFIEVRLLRVTRDLADWAGTLPEGLLNLVPSLTPLPASGER